MNTLTNFLQLFFMIFCAMFFPFSALPEILQIVSRIIQLSYCVDLFRSTMIGVTPELLPFEIKNNIEQQGLSLYQGVILASIIEREAIVEEEMPIIASVFINRLNIGMKLETDPTVQYALGFNPTQNTWWTNPLSFADLEIDSPYNTYLYAGLPPAPIANPSLAYIPEEKRLTGVSMNSRIPENSMIASSRAAICVRVIPKMVPFK